MAAKGAVAKQTITEEILNCFPGSFVHDKVIRIPIMENGAIVEIKVALTCAKDIIGNAVSVVSGNGAVSENVSTMTDAEIENVRIMMEHLNL